MKESPLWPQFDEFLETRSQACRERERLGLATSGTQPGGVPIHEYTRCKSKNHNLSYCRAQFCLQCRAWTNVGIIHTGNKETLHGKRRMETPTVSYAKKATHLEVIQNQEQNQGRGTPEQLLDRGHTCRQQQRVGGARWR
jgi:hypothetical protein